MIVAMTMVMPMAAIMVVAVVVAMTVIVTVIVIVVVGHQGTTTAGTVQTSPRVVPTARVAPSTATAV